jgi:hypothetical protein
MNSMQVSALTMIARLIAEDPELPPVGVQVYEDGRVYLTAFYAEPAVWLTAAEAERTHDVWARLLGLDAEEPHDRDQDDDGPPLRYFRANGMWAGVRVSVSTAGPLATVEQVSL